MMCPSMPPRCVRATVLVSGADVPQALGELLDELNDVGFEDEVEIEKEP